MAAFIERKKEQKLEISERKKEHKLRMRKMLMSLFFMVFLLGQSMG